MTDSMFQLVAENAQLKASDNGNMIADCHCKSAWVSDQTFEAWRQEALAREHMSNRGLASTIKCKMSGMCKHIMANLLQDGQALAGESGR